MKTNRLIKYFKDRCGLWVISGQKVKVFVRR